MPGSDAEQARGFAVAPFVGEQRVAAIRLARSENVGPATFRDLIAHCSTPSDALAHLPELSRRGGHRTTIRIAAAKDIEAELKRAEKFGARFLLIGDADYPAPLAALDAPPPVIAIKGDANLLNRPSVGIVGSRACSAAGTRIAAQLARGIGIGGFVITSGLARGIDAAAHTAAMETGTVAVVANGLDVVYPPEHEALQRTIGERGCTVTEMPFGYVARAQSFPRRNRIISGLSLGVVIVEAARRSGSLVTARLAAEQGREVFAVPGHPLDPRAEGTNGLLKSGATLVTEADDVIAALMPLTDTPLRHFREDQPAVYPHAGEWRDSASGDLGANDTRQRSTLSPGHASARTETIGVEALTFANRTAAAGITANAPPGRAPSGQPVKNDSETIIGALGPAPTDIDSLVRSTGLSIRSVQVALIELALAGRIERHGAGLVALAMDAPNDP
ncbi:DNA-processing protein DprA [Hyphomicrobium sp. D-2]|uniref:DNA-processing protein DprA n=1 Tax=Hyphomicrobium sp. D-2 TaxID=3041621 RepID=UPI002455039F|nr:DNA-processing protein DprA [Hyphomicrobium sp. D-2]MDH4982736.1 DNA-processing protein DprA [Hyphomicrobium sp. D-2]